MLVELITIPILIKRWASPSIRAALYLFLDAIVVILAVIAIYLLAPAANSWIKGVVALVGIAAYVINYLCCPTRVILLTSFKLHA